MATKPPKPSYAEDEQPPDPTPGDPGPEADRQHDIERRRLSEQEADKTNKVKRTPQSN